MERDLYAKGVSVSPLLLLIRVRCCSFNISGKILSSSHGAYGPWIIIRTGVLLQLTLAGISSGQGNVNFILEQRKLLYLLYGIILRI